MKDKVIKLFVLFAVLFFTANIVMARDIYYPRPVSPAVETVTCTAKSAAAGQHNYKAGTSLQWSVGLSADRCSAALSLGLGIQNGNVFLSGNLSNNIFNGEAEPMFSFGASGTF